MPKINETISSPNQSSRGTHKPQLIVCHICDGTYEGTKAWFLNSASQTSSHFIVSKNGMICQCVPLDKMAWCNGTTDATAANSTVPLVKSLKGNANQYSVSIEFEGYWSKTKGELTDDQLDSGVWLIEYIRDRVKSIYGNEIQFDREHIIGHNEINPVMRANCPGERFQWPEIMAMLSSEKEDNVAYRIQLGYFEIKSNADAYLRTVQEKFKDAFIQTDEESGSYTVQLGYFESRENAEKYLKSVREVFPDSFIKIGKKKEA